MNHTKFNPVQPSDAIGKWIDTLFNTTLSDAIGMDYAVSNPSVNITEDDAKFNLQLAAPGLTKQDFNIRVENDHLVISVEKKNESEETVPGRFTRREFNYSSFKKSFHLDDKINREGINAAYENGILNLTLPKKNITEEKSSSKVIEIS
ncbi:MAG TPA: Hsp20/alpha crystallin family protein [Saprospiraceae bacterium]|nr:Hsp20/alpha crystallin family protein [Saprospiraceae bacterium]